MVKPINYSLITALPVATFAYLHNARPQFAFYPYKKQMFFIFFHSRNLRDSWADRREILHGGQY